MSKAGKSRQCNRLAAETAAAAAGLIRQGVADVTKLDDQLLGAVLMWTLDAKDREVHAAVYPESEVRSLLCHWCASLVLRGGGTRERWTVVHAADCLLWQRYTQRAGGYTALPSGELWRGGQPWPQGATAVLSNSPGSPCGTVVTWRGPYSSRTAQEAAEGAAVRKGTAHAR